MILHRRASILLSCLALPILLSLAGCSALKSIAVTPAAGVVVLTAVGQTAQFKALGTSQMGSGQPTTSSVTVNWSVSNPNVATINSATGLATAVGAGTTQIIAESGGITATSDLTVTISSSPTGTPPVPSSPSITVTPDTSTETFTGETTQFIATGNLTGTGSAQNLTTQVQWISSKVQVATINSSGVATAVGAGTTTIIAQSGGLNATATLTVTTGVASTTQPLTLIPNSGATASFIGETTQFIALGNLSGGIATQNLTGNVAWFTSDVSVATIDQNGLATAVSANQVVESTTITAIGTTSIGSLITATTTLTVLPTGGAVNLPSLAIYEVGTGTGTVTSSPSSPAILCGSAAAGASCTGFFPLNTLVTLTATPGPASVFGGWSTNCAPVASNPMQCTIKMSNNETVGAIFNP